MEKYQINQFVEKTKQQDKGQGLFELETERILEINLEQQIWAKMGTMISYRGNIKFERKEYWSTDLANSLKRPLQVRVHL